jgi:hypothetical protein
MISLYEYTARKHLSKQIYVKHFHFLACLKYYWIVRDNVALTFTVLSPEQWVVG